MDSILKEFSISFLLRSAFSGIFFVISYYVASHNPVEFAKIDGTKMFSVALPVAVFAGVVAYGIYRSLLYPFIEGYFNSKNGKAWRKRRPLISSSTISTLLWRWNQGADKPDLKRINEHLSTWADFIHLQFTSALCIGLGAGVGVIIVPTKHSTYCPLICLAGLLFFAACVSNWRHYSVLDHIRN